MEKVSLFCGGNNQVCNFNLLYLEIGSGSSNVNQPQG